MATLTRMSQRGGVVDMFLCIGLFVGARSEDWMPSVAKTHLEDLFLVHAIPESHGIGHALRVLAHVEQALHASMIPLNVSRRQTICLAALLHDADDRKYFPGGPEAGYPNARQIAQVAGASEEITNEVIYMISLVSTNSNGNSVPPRAFDEPELLWPRWADRLDAIGDRGVVRCWQYCNEGNRPLFDLSTPRPTSEDEVWSHADPSKLEAYMAKALKSKTMLDHYYIVLLSVARPPRLALQNPYLETEFEKGAAPLVNVCLEFGATGGIDEDRIRNLAARLDAEEDTMHQHGYINV